MGGLGQAYIHTSLPYTVQRPQQPPAIDSIGARNSCSAMPRVEVHERHVSDESGIIDEQPSAQHFNAVAPSVH